MRRQAIKRSTTSAPANSDFKRVMMQKYRMKCENNPLWVYRQAVADYYKAVRDGEMPYVEDALEL